MSSVPEGLLVSYNIVLNIWFYDFSQKLIRFAIFHVEVTESKFSRLSNSITVHLNRFSSTTHENLPKHTKKNISGLLISTTIFKWTLGFRFMSFDAFFGADNLLVDSEFEINVECLVVELWKPFSALKTSECGAMCNIESCLWFLQTKFWWKCQNYSAQSGWSSHPSLNIPR